MTQERYETYFALPKHLESKEPVSSIFCKHSNSVCYDMRHKNDSSMIEEFLSKIKPDKVVSMSKGYLSPDPDEKKYPNGVRILTLCYTTD